MTTASESPKPVAAPKVTETDAKLADGNFAADKVLTEALVTQGAHLDDVKESEQNKPQVGKNVSLLEKEAEEADKERQKLRDQLRKDREKAEKNS